MTDRFQAVLLFGAPGAGKGTQGELIGKVPGFFHMSTGDMFRSLDKHSDIGKVFFDYSSKGELVPDEVTVALWHQYVHAQTTLGIYHPVTDLLILDGIPRTAAQTGLMDQYIEVLGVIHLVANDRDEMVKRLSNRAMKQKRIDDAKEDVVRNRLDVYDRETKPVLDHYNPSLIHEVDAIGSPGAVLGNILSVLAPIHENRFANCLEV
jgi:adenylate kinase